jgi:hypothetical protein
MSGQVARNYRQERDAKASGSVPLKNPRFEKLSREFAAGATQSDAWRAAYGSEPSTGNPSRTFARPEIQTRIEFLRNKFNEMAGLSLSALQARLLRFADANPADLLEIVPSTRQGSSGPPQLRLRDITTLAPGAKAAISELEIEGGDVIKLKTVKAADRLHALDSLIKTVNGFAPEESEGRGMTLEDLVNASMRTDRPTAVRVEVVSDVPRSPDRAPTEDAAPRENQIETQTDVRRVRLDRVRIQRSV